MSQKQGNKITMLIITAALMLTAAGLASATTESIELGDYTVKYEYNNDDARSGEKFSLTITVTNNGNEEKRDIRLRLDEQDPFTITGDDDLRITALAANASRSKTFRLEIDKDAKTGDYDVDFDLEDDKDSFDDSITIEATSITPEIIIGNVASSPAIITPDMKDIKLTLTLENTGDGDANFLRAKLILPKGLKPSSSYSDTANLGTINNGEGKEAIFFIDSEKDLENGMHEANLEIEYEDEEDNKFTKTLTFDIPVKGKPQFEITNIQVEPANLTPGMKDSSIRITIKNIGADKGEETSLRIFENSDQPFEYHEKTNFIGDLESGESGTGIFTFDVNANAEQNTYLVRLQIRTVNEGNVVVSEEKVPVKVGQGEGLGIGKIIPAASIVLAVIIIILFLATRRRRG